MNKLSPISRTQKEKQRCKLNSSTKKHNSDDEKNKLIKYEQEPKRAEIAYLRDRWRKGKDGQKKKRQRDRKAKRRPKRDTFRREK